MSSRRLFSSILVLGAICFWGCSTPTPKPEWHEEKAFLEEVIKWNWSPQDVYIELEISDSGNFLRNIEPSVQIMRETGYFTDRFCDAVEKGYKDCDRKFRHEDIDDHVPCQEVNPVAYIDEENLDSMVVKRLVKEAKGSVVEVEIFASSFVGGNREIVLNNSMELTFFLVEEAGKLRIDSTSALSEVF